jgi:uncharacterized membrane protein YgdD (TMEM256/DUF423 family)
MTFVRIGAWSAFVAVAAGAFGAHALHARLAPDLLAVFETAVRYQLVHALALVLVGVLADRPGVPSARPSAWPLLSGWLFVSGTVLFSGSLYALVLSGVRLLGAVTPFGGACFLAGWLALAAGARRT